MAKWMDALQFYILSNRISVGRMGTFDKQISTMGAGQGFLLIFLPTSLEHGR